MRDVIIALVPAMAVACVMFGIHALLLICVSVVSCVCFEWGYRKLMKKPDTISDCSAAVTGVLLACCLPPAAPLWLPIIGAFSPSSSSSTLRRHRRLLATPPWRPAFSLQLGVL
jgi:electron transport complex protein RnfD